MEWKRVETHSTKGTTWKKVESTKSATWKRSESHAFHGISAKSSAINFATRELLYFYCILSQKRYKLDIVKICKLLLRKTADIETTLAECNCTAEEIDKVRFMMCTLLDETIAYYVDGETFSDYRSLTSHYYKEQLGGEHVFSLLEGCLRDAKANFPILALGHKIICLGFTGQYALQHGGGITLSEIKDKIFLAITPFLAEHKKHILQKGDYGQSYLLKKLKRTLAPIMGLLLLGTYIFLYQDLNYKRQQLEEVIKDSFNL